jgi:hypothetical protein
MTERRMVNFRLEEPVIYLFDEIARRAEFTRSAAVRQTAQAAAGVLLAARQQSVTRLVALRNRYGDDAQLTLTVVADEDGSPRGHLVIDGQVPDDATAVAVVVPDSGRAILYVDVPGAAHPAEWLLARYGGYGVLVRDALLPVGDMAWPPRPKEGIVIRLGDLDKVIAADPMLAEPVEA